MDAGDASSPGASRRLARALMIAREKGEPRFKQRPRPISPPTTPYRRPRTNPLVKRRGACGTDGLAQAVLLGVCPTANDETVMTCVLALSGLRRKPRLLPLRRAAQISRGVAIPTIERPLTLVRHTPSSPLDRRTRAETIVPRTDGPYIEVVPRHNHPHIPLVETGRSTIIGQGRRGTEHPSVGRCWRALPCWRGWMP